ncbi:glycoside hydrolase family 3 N-terminal domain-containing protein [Candidatus Aeolococcus gillhamiae]|uniref:glycoside hydrolase family 3 N-terminal domain-containing protein n=1 Tax=Candidatus Aeolococcus gillhamiae TaxID=3127015 RepID=UPI0030768817
MSSPSRWPLVAVGLSAAMCACSSAAPTTPSAALATKAAVSGVPPVTPATLPLSVAVGQMLVASVSGPVVTDGLRHLILDDKVGTVLLFRSNFGDAAGLRSWTTQLQALGRIAGLPAPLLVTTDEEGGSVDQVANGLHLLPAAQALGSEGSAGVRRDVAAMAGGLRADGVGLDLAPVADLRTNPADAVIGSRSFGSDASVVGPLVAAYVNGLHDGGVGATLKHFPGLGGAAGDPHRQVVTDLVTLAQWSATTARSFAAGIGAGADAVMTTSLRVPNLDPSNRPALLSPVIVRLLRDTLRFSGVVLTDSLSMTAVGESMPRATVDAAAAGNDLLLMSSGSTTLEDQADQMLLAAVRSGAIPEGQVQASAQRVLALHRRYVLT